MTLADIPMHPLGVFSTVHSTYTLAAKSVC